MKKLLLVTSIGILISMSLYSQRIRISGQVIDSENDTPLPGASVIIEGTSKGTITDIYGNYDLLVEDEESILVFSFLGFVSQRIPIGNERIINVELAQDITSLDEVVVTMQARGQIGARQQQIDSPTLVNIAASERLQENPDANALEAIGRLPGISIIRSGGEGVGLIIRGMDPSYSNFTLEGLNLPILSGNQRNADISGVSQYVIQGVEVFKALTPDMDANTVGGAVNLKLQEVRPERKMSFLAQGGYNNLNAYFGNYSFQGEFSNRFFDDKLGVSLSFNAERVNRSVETMSASYSLEAAEVDILLNNVVLNKIMRINTRRSATLALDYKLHNTTKLKFLGLFTNYAKDFESQRKSYNLTGTGSVGYGQSYNKDRIEDMLHLTLTGNTILNFLNLELDYGVAYSFAIVDDPIDRSWNWGWDNVATNVITTRDQRRLDPVIQISMFDDHPDSLNNTSISSVSVRDEIMRDDNYQGFLNIKVPYKIGNLITGYAKFGGIYRVKKRLRDITSGTRGMDQRLMHTIMPTYLPWVETRGTSPMTTMIGLEDYIVEDYLGGAYEYGWWFRSDRLNQITDWWTGFCDSLYALGQDVWSEYFFTRHYMGYGQNVRESMIDDQDLKETYYAGYLMTQLEFGSWGMFMPGVRFEDTEATMNGWFAYEPFNPDPTFYPLPTQDTSAKRFDKFLLPMVHLRIKPTKFMYLHLAYTETLSRPSFNAISPNFHVNPERTPYGYTAQNPELKTEQWTNYDVQLAFHSNKIGLLSISGFYKTVQDKIWRRTFKRLASDPIIYPYGERDIVDVTVWENHPYEIFLTGIEMEWQTSFWHLPSPFRYFTLTINGTYTHSETRYPYTELRQITPPEGGRPITVRVDSTTIGPMLYQPKYIGNASLGFNLRGINAWLSFQYNGEIFTYKHFVLDDLDRLNEHFYRFDLHIVYSIPFKLPGKLQVLGNMSNISNFMETSRLRGDERFTNQEAYGWTVDLGIRYKF